MIKPEHHLDDFAAIDFEAANGKVTSACSMGLVIVRDNQIVERFYSLMKPVPNKYDYYKTAFLIDSGEPFSTPATISSSIL